jgi:Zn-finger nucleic acid-binding protein
MTCPSCGAPITLRPDTEGYKCDYCHTVFFPGEEDTGVEITGAVSGDSLSCPLCRLSLVPAAIAKIPVNYCTQCHGLLFPMPVLQPLLEQLRSGDRSPAVQAPPDRGDLKRVIQCPQCNRRMDTHFYAGPGNVIVDTCDACNLIWLDRGELTRIAHAPDESDDSEPNWS